MRLKAVVIDANVFGRGALPDLDLLERTAANLAALGLECWVCEPVLWELAEHLATAVDGARSVIRKTRSQLERAHLSTHGLTLPYADRAETIAAVEAACAAVPNLIIVPLSGEAAIAGLRDQIQQSGPGTTKGEADKQVKTGAADSAWVRDALARAGGDPRAILIATANRGDVEATCEAIGVPAPVMCEMRNLPHLLSKFVPAPQYLTRLVTQALINWLPCSMLADPHSTHDELSIDLGAVQEWSGDVDDTGITLDSVEIRSLDALVWVRDVEIDADQVETTEPVTGHGGRLPPSVIDGRLSADVGFLGTVDAYGYTLDNDGAVKPWSGSNSNAIIRATVWVRVTDGAVVDATGTGDTTVSVDQGEERFDESRDALEEAIQRIELLPGVQLPDAWPFDAEPDDLEQVLDVDGGPLHVDFSGEPYEDWTLTLEAGEESVLLRAEYDPGALVADGRESFHIWPPYLLWSTTDGRLGNAWNAIARMLTVLTKNPP